MSQGLLTVLLFCMPVVWLVLRLAGSQRRERLAREWAARVGWHYVGTDRSLLTRWYHRPFGVGEEQRISELVTGTWAGRTALSFAYGYTTGRGKERQDHLLHVAVLQLPAYLPTVALTPENLATRLAKALGGQDVVVESEAFNKAWRVEAPDARFAHDVVHPRLMERLLQADARGLSLRLEGTDLLCWTTGAPHLDDLARRLGVMTAVVESVPRYVWVDHGYDPART